MLRKKTILKTFLKIKTPHINKYLVTAFSTPTND